MKYFQIKITFQHTQTKTPNSYYPHTKKNNQKSLPYENQLISSFSSKYACCNFLIYLKIKMNATLTPTTETKLNQNHCLPSNSLTKLNQIKSDGSGAFLIKNFPIFLFFFLNFFKFFGSSEVTKKSFFLDSFKTFFVID